MQFGLFWVNCVLTLITTCQARVLVFFQADIQNRWAQFWQSLVHHQTFSLPQLSGLTLCAKSQREQANGDLLINAFRLHNVSFSFLQRLLGFCSWYAAGCRLIRTAWAVSPSTLIGEDEACFQLCGCLLDNCGFFGSSCGVYVTSFSQPACCWSMWLWH